MKRRKLLPYTTLPFNHKLTPLSESNKDFVIKLNLDYKDLPYKRKISPRSNESTPISSPVLSTSRSSNNLESFV